MPRRFAVLMVAAPFLVASCGDSTAAPSGAVSDDGGSGDSGGASADAGAPRPVDPTYVVDLALPAPSSLPGVPADVKVYLDVPYGTDPLQRFDVVLPTTATPAPLIVYVHGGGFVSGDKKISNTKDVERVVTSGVAFASLNYRLLGEVDKEGVIKPMTDSKRALQFIRYHASKLGVDASRVGLTGDSGGAGTILWIGMHDDMAANGDAVDAMSTRVTAVAPVNTQSTYDLAKWETVVFAEYGTSLLQAIELLGREQRFLSFYGMTSVDQFDTLAMKAYRAEVDMFAHMSADDPPVFVRNNNPATAAPATQGELFHHGAHAKAIEAEGTKVGVSVTAVIPAFGVDEASGKDEWSFLLDRLKNK